MRTWSDGDEAKIPQDDDYSGRERRSVGAVEERRKGPCHRSGSRPGTYQYLGAHQAERGHPAASPTTLGSVVVAGGARRDLSRHCGRPICARDRGGAGPFGFDGQPRGQAQRRLASLSSRGG